MASANSSITRRASSNGGAAPGALPLPPRNSEAQTPEYKSLVQAVAEAVDCGSSSMLQRAAQLIAQNMLQADASFYHDVNVQVASIKRMRAAASLAKQHMMQLQVGVPELQGTVMMM